MVFAITIHLFKVFGLQISVRIFKYYVSLLLFQFWLFFLMWVDKLGLKDFKKEKNDALNKNKLSKCLIANILVGVRR